MLTLEILFAVVAACTGNCTVTGSILAVGKGLRCCTAAIIYDGTSSSKGQVLQVWM